MEHMKHQAHAQTADPHVKHKISEPHASHDRHAGHSVAMFHDKFWLSFALTIPVVFWSPDVQHWLAYTALSFPGTGFAIEDFQPLHVKRAIENGRRNRV